MLPKLLNGIERLFTAVLLWNLLTRNLANLDNLTCLKRSTICSWENFNFPSRKRNFRGRFLSLLLPQCVTWDDALNILTPMIFKKHHWIQNILRNSIFFAKISIVFGHIILIWVCLDERWVGQPSNDISLLASNYKKNIIYSSLLVICKIFTLK